MKKPDSDMAAVFFITSKPIDPFLKGKWDPGFKFLSVPYDARFEDYYLPTTLEYADYPNLIAAGERIETIAAPTILVAYNWREKYGPLSAGSSRLSRTCSAASTNCRRLASTPSGRTSISMPRSPGLARFKAAQEWLDANVPKVGMRP